MKKINTVNKGNTTGRPSKVYETLFGKARLLLPAGLLTLATLSQEKALAQVSVTSSGGTTTPTSYATLNAAFSAINSGTHQGVINISITGNTTEPATPTPLLASSGSSSYTAINIRPSGGNFVINANAAPASSRGIIELAGADNVTIDGDDPSTAGNQNLSIIAPPVSTSGVACIRLSSNSSSGADGANNNTIKNCIITGSRSSSTSSTTNYGIQFSNGTSTSSSSTGAYSSLNTTIQNNIIKRCYYGVYAYGNSTTYLNTGTVIKDNVIGSTVAADNVGLRGIYASYTGTAAPGALIIDNNEIMTGESQSGLGATVAAIELAAANAYTVISNNNIHDVANPSTGGWGAHGVSITSGTSNNNISIRNNFIRDITTTNYSTSLTTQYQNFGIYVGAAATALSIIHNTIVLNKANATNYGTSNPVSACITLTSTTAVVSQLLNNILINKQGTASTNAFCMLTSATGNISAGTVNNNNYFYNGNGKTGYYNAANQTTLANWQTATGKDAASISDNTFFISATDLHVVQGTYTLVESGGATTAITGVTTDKDGQTRPGTSTYGYGTAPDIGADEFDGRGVLCGVPAPGNTLSATSGSLCVGNTISLSLSAPPSGGGFTYQWQTSADNITYSNISGATANTYNGPATAIYYRCMVKCPLGPDSTASTPLQLTFNSGITGTTPAQRCGNGTVDLAATATAGATVKWFSTLTGGTAIATGSPFTTPVINNTTDFYAESQTIAPGSVTMGTGTSSTGTTSFPNPLSAYYGGTKHQMLFLASELQAQGLSAGDITAISFDVATFTASGVCQDFTIRMGTTTNTAMSGFVTGTVPVYNATYTPSATGIVTFTLSAPFSWNGTSNIIVETVHNAGNGGNGSGTTTRYTTTPFNSVYSRAIDNITPAGVPSFDATTSTAGSTVTSADRPNIVFTGQKVCSSPRVPVTATVNTPPVFTITPNQAVCNNAITPLTVTSSTASFNAYTWSPATNLYTDAAATVAYTAGSNATTVYLKSATSGTLIYTANASNSTTQCAAVTSDTITILPATVTATATPSFICNSGTTTLSLNPASGYDLASFKWQSATDNLNFVDEGANSTSATYTTPTLTASKYYRVTIRNTAGAVCLNSASDTAVVYIPAITATTPGARCGTGTVTLGATGNNNTTPVWYSAATGGGIIGTGTTFTTPSISTTTNYWVAPRVTGTIDTATVGNGTSLTTDTEEFTSFCNRRLNYRMQMIFTPAELNAVGIYGGEINSIGFRITTIGTAATNANFVVKMGTTTQNTFSNYINTGMNTVYGPVTYTHAVGLNTIPLSTSYTWDGTSNLVVEITHDGANGLYNATTYYSTTSSAMVGYSYNSATTATTTTKRPNTTFGLKLCEGPRQQVTATVNPNPVPAVTPNGTVQVCAGSTTTLTASGGGNYQWRNAAGNINGQTASTFTTGTAGTYRVVVTTPATGCVDTSAVVTVNVNQLPVVNLGNDTTFCSGPSLTLNAANTGATFLWDNASTNQTRTVNATGTYYVKVTNSNNCSKNDTIQVTVNPTPIVDLGNDTSLCQGQNLVLNSGNPGATRLWDNGTTAQTRTVNATGTYYVKVTNAFNCSAGDTVTATFLPSPTVNLGNDIAVCAGNSITLNAGNPGETYLWDNGATTQTRTVSTSGTYHVTVTNVANCKGSDTIDVLIRPLPVVNLGNDTVFCHDNTLVLDAGNPGANYLWNDNSTGQTLAVNSTGTYGVVVTDVHNCVGSDNINILVKDLPSGTINAVYGDTATYTFNVLNPKYVTSYTWNFGDGSPTVTGAIVQHRYASNGIYTVSVLLGGECDDNTVESRTVDVYDGTTGIGKVEDSKDLLLYPNPAKDLVTVENKNNLRLKHVTVYNVIGQMIYDAKADDQNKHQIRTHAMASGMYTIRIETDKGFVIRKFEIVK